MKMFFYRLLFVLVFAFLFFTAVPSVTHAATLPAHYNGATLLPRNSTDPSSAQWKQTLREMRANNVNMVTYILLYRQTDIHSNEIYESSNNPTDASLIEGIQYAHSLGLRVQLKPHVDNDDTPTYWRGEIDPTDRAVWFSNYGKILKHISDIARENNVEELCIGTELYDLTVPGPGAYSMNTYYWTNLIAQIRANYSGVLTYSSIFIYELDAIEFWPQLDYIGISGYWQLSSDKNPTVEQLRNSWSSINASVLQPLSARNGKPIVLTESGYRSWDCATVYPWGTPACGTAVNLSEQTNAYEALLSFWSNQPNLKGIVLWGWEPDPASGGAQDNTFTPQNKPAMQVVKNWFSGSATPLPPPSTTADVFTDNYQMDWTNWSWDTTVAVSDSPNGVNGRSLKMITTQPWGGLRLNSFVGLQTNNYNRFNFSIYSPSNQSYGVWMVDSAAQQGNVLTAQNYLVSSTNGWKNYSIPLSDLGAANKIIKDIYVQDWSGQVNAVTYFDLMQFQGNPLPSPSPSVSPSPSPVVSPSPSPSPSFVPRAGTSITANPNPCFIAAGTNTCSETISWSVTNPQGTVEVRVRENNGLFGRAPYGSQNAPWVSETPLHMDLYDANMLVNSVTITGSTKRGTITANPNPCQIPTGGTTCTETITWSVGNPQGVVEVRVRETNGLFGRAPYGSQNAPWVSETPLHMDLYDGNSLVDSVTIQGVSNSITPSPVPSPSPSTPITSAAIYTDSLASGWVNWSWDSVIDFASDIFYGGFKSISFKTTAAWGGLHFHSDSGINTSAYTHLEFAAKADANNKSYGVMLIDKDNKQIGQSLSLSNYGGSPVSDAFKLYDIPLTDFGPKGIVKGVIIQDWSGQANSLLNVDEIKFVSK